MSLFGVLPLLFEPNIANQAETTSSNPSPTPQHASLLIGAGLAMALKRSLLKYKSTSPQG